MSDAHTLVVMRHAKSSWRTADPDIGRPLSKRGSRDAVVAGQMLGRFHFDVVILSPAQRSQQTWQVVGMTGVQADAVRTEDAVYHAGTPEIVEVVRSLPSSARTVLLVGHQPTVSDLVVSLSAGSDLADRVAERFPTCAVALLRVRTPWEALEPHAATLAAFEVPRG